MVRKIVLLPVKGEMFKGLVLESLLSILTEISRRQKDKQFRLSIVRLQDPRTVKKFQNSIKRKGKEGRKEKRKKGRGERKK